MKYSKTGELILEKAVINIKCLRQDLTNTNILVVLFDGMLPCTVRPYRSYIFSDKYE